MSWQPTGPSLDDLLAPISDGDPCGENLRHAPEMDRLRQMRREDDPSLPEGVWQAELKRGDWSGVEALAGDLLCRRSKDLMLAAWLGEAWLMRHGLHGAAPALGLLAGLWARYPDDLHPRAEDDDRSWRVAPLEWVARRYNELLLTRCPMLGVVEGDLAEVTLAHWQGLKQRQVQVGDSKAAKAAAEAARLEQSKLDEALRRLPAEQFVTLDAELGRALAELARLERGCDEWLGELAPGFGPLRGVLDALHAFVHERLPYVPEVPPMPEPVSTPEHEAAPTTAAVAALPAGAPSSREEAYRQLAQIADFLARTEPHSPVPYVIRRAVEWGHQPLSSLLDELLNADAESRRLWQLLGVLR